MIEVRTLTDGGQGPLDVAQEVVDFIGSARRSLDFAHYDFHLSPEPAAMVAAAIHGATARGVAVRFLYNLDHRNPIPVPPPPEPDGILIESLGVPVRPIAGVPDLMHHKFVVRDGTSIWTGSTNWTDDSWSWQENVVAVAHSPELAGRFTEDFEQLWETGLVERSGFVDTTPVPVGDDHVRPWFTPGHGEGLSFRIGKAIAKAKRRVRIASPVITAAPVLSALSEVISEGRVDVAGCVDRPQIDGVIYQWGENGNIAWKLPLLERVLEAPFSAKPSTPWEPTGSVHDFMHAKLTVTDDTVFLGSFNLSRSGELNAENVIEVRSPDLAERLAAFVDDVRALYPRFTPTR
ncbi:MAG TPA: phosphatidylserine/phosphatidylglycerophosphate/cardiolipin synthase family protein [Gaiellaceae bacterium]|nr:phosphatidylserine/phosphatidylglycerophosphate/cardiolipin synthase family protein [Gaiellaceae bacterium]